MAPRPPLLRFRSAALAPPPGGGVELLAGRSDQEPFLLQLAGPVRREWRKAVERLGIELLEYLPDHAYVARGSTDALGRLADLPFVTALLPYEPRLRVHPTLRDSDGRGRMALSLYRGAVPSLVAASAALLGVEVQAVRSRSVIVEGEHRHSERLASLPGVSWVEPASRLRFLNDRSRVLLHVPNVWRDLKLFGAGQVVAVTDTGLSTGDLETLHPDLVGRVRHATGLGERTEWFDTTGHGTHVSASIVGTGVASGADPVAGRYEGSFAGIAPEARLVVQAVEVNPITGGSAGLPEDVSDLMLQAYELGARIHNNSWGDDDTVRGDYNLHAQQIDDFVWQHPGYLVLFAAGNEGTEEYEEPPPDPEEEDPDGGAGPPPGTGGPYPWPQEDPPPRRSRIGEGSVYAPSTAKNCISVGASEGLRPPDVEVPSTLFTWEHFGFQGEPFVNDYVSDNPNGMVAFSSRGPALDGRTKPDLVAPGSNIASARAPLMDSFLFWHIPQGRYAYAGGTSMACAFATGVATLVRQALITSRSTQPSAALVKALLLNTAQDLSPGQYGPSDDPEVPVRPNCVEGWGRVDAQAAVGRAPGRLLGLWDEPVGLFTGDARRFYVRVPADGGRLSVHLVWSDYPASLAADKALVNDLDLTVTTPDGRVLRGNGGEDRINNVEGIDLSGVRAGVYRIDVSAYEVASEAPQRYALVVSGPLDPGFRLRASGDVDASGAVDILDVIMLLRLVIIGIPGSDPLNLVADVSPPGRPDGRVDIADAVRLLRFTVGLESGVWP